jgi:hypothetical protein
LTSFARVETARGERLDVDFGGRARLLSWEITPGTTLHGPGAYARVTTYWRAEQPITDLWLPTLFIAGIDEKVVAADPYPPVGAWYPMTDWAPGQIVKIEYPNVPLKHLDEALLFAGISVRNSKAEITGLVPPRPPAELLDNLSADGTMYRLASLRRG